MLMMECVFAELRKKLDFVLRRQQMAYTDALRLPCFSVGTKSYIVYLRDLARSLF